MRASALVIAFASALLAARAQPQDAAARRAALLEQLASLDAASGARFDGLAAALRSAGPPAADLALGADAPSFAALPLAARRARSELVRAIGDARSLAAAVDRLDDSDDVVRANLIAFLATAGSADAAAAELSARAIERAACDWETGAARAQAIEALAKLDHAAGSDALVRLLAQTAGSEQELVARALARQPRARAAIVDAVQHALAGERAHVGDAALFVLLAEHYGEALAELPGGGDAPRDRAAFVLGARHPDARVRVGAAEALANFVDRCAALGQVERAERALAALVDCGLDDFELLLRRGQLALQRGPDAQVARAAGREIVRRNPPTNAPLQRQRRAAGELLSAVASLALGRGEEALAPLREAERLLEALRAERWDLRNPPRRGQVDLREIDALAMRALVPLYRALILLAAGADSASVGVLEAAREADVALLETELALARDRLPLSVDNLFQHALGPARLLFVRARATLPSPLELERGLYAAFSTVTRGSIPGFPAAPTQAARLADPCTDNQRRELLHDVQSERHRAQLTALDEQAVQLLEGTGSKAQAGYGERDPAVELKLVELSALRRLAERLHDEELKQGDDGLRRQREISRAGLVLTARLREQGRAQAARQLAEQVGVDLEAQRGAGNDFVFEGLLSAADVELAGALMDQGEAVAAEVALERALARLEAQRSELAGRNAAVGAEFARTELANVLVSLAVNANVKLRQPERALAYFERAYALDQRDFMRVLLACYRARAGRADEARALIRDVPVAPDIYYNLACTHALLGERELALDFLARDFAEVRTGAGARAKQAAWAKGDPDLESLRDDPRFVELIRGASGGANK